MLHDKNTNFANLQAKCARAPGIFAGPLASPTLMVSLSLTDTHAHTHFLHKPGVWSQQLNHRDKASREHDTDAQKQHQDLHMLENTI